MYEGVLTIPASTLAAGDYPVMAILRIEDEETDPLASTETVRIVEPVRGIPPETRNRVASFRASFSTNSDLLDSQDDEALQQLAKELLPFADLIEAVVVQGHCDARGPDTYNETLGARRAGTTARGLRAFLQEKIAVASESLGETAANQTAQDEATWQKDRWARLDLKERAPAQGR
jgi:outer membrane protein OmpA-like peptidoglycan-associated protein